MMMGNKSERFINLHKVKCQVAEAGMTTRPDPQYETLCQADL